MAGVVSAIEVYTLIDQAGNPHTIGWFDYEFQENYATGGIAGDFSSYFRVMQDVFGRVVSGATLYNPMINEADLDAPSSARIKLMGTTSGAMTVAEAPNGIAVSGTRGRLLIMGY